MSQRDVDQVLLQERDGIAVLTLNNPDRMNPFGMAMRHRLAELLQQVMYESDCRAVVLHGAGEHMTCGGDITEMEQRSLPEGRQRVEVLARIFRLLVNGPKPVLAAVEGHCMGVGLSLVAASDYAVASREARFGCAFIKVGLLPDTGAIWSLPRKVGYRKAMELAAFGDKFDAEEALRIQLLNRLCEPGQAMETALEAAQRLAAHPPLAVSLLKAAMNGGADTVEQAIRTETEYQAMCYSTADHGEAAAAFREKRKPQFTGR